MKKLLFLILCVGLILSCTACTARKENAQIVATTLPVYEFTVALCEGTDLSVTRLITEEVSCLHDYSLQTKQMRAIEGAELIVLSGGGLEEFLEDALSSGHTSVDASQNISLHCGDDHHHEGHHHEHDPHIWLSPENAKHMVENICLGLTKQYPQYRDIFESNQAALLEKLDKLQLYGQQQLEDLSYRELITFHDGFSYLAESFDLHILHAIEEEAGSEASAAELIELINLVRQHKLPAIFTERSGSTSAASVIARETGIKQFTLDMAMAGNSYFDAMKHNIDTLKEALG